MSTQLLPAVKGRPWSHVLWVVVLLGGLLASPARCQAQPEGIFADFITTAGRFTCSLDAVRSPKAAALFIGLATGERPWLDLKTGAVRSQPFYDGQAFTFVRPGTLIQAGSIQDVTSASPDLAFVATLDPSLAFASPGLLAFPSEGTRCQGAEFFITLSSQPDLNGAGTVLGEVIEGREVVDGIGAAPLDAHSRPLTDIAIQHIQIRRVGPAAVAFDVNSQGLPVVAQAPMAITANSGMVNFTIPQKMFAEHLLFSSTNLVDWTAQSLGVDLDALTPGSLTRPANASAEFFRLVQVQYPSSTWAPRQWADKTLTLFMPNGPATLLRFDAQGVLTCDVAGQQVVVDYAWRQAVYRGFLGPIHLPGLPTLTLQLDFASADGGTFRDARSAVSGRFAVNPGGLEAHWALDGDWHDALGLHDLFPTTTGGFSLAPQLRPGTNGCYGPTLAGEGNGAVSLTLTNLPEDRGVTLEGWVNLPHDSASGLLFGFGNQAWDQPTLSVTAAWGFIWVRTGAKNDGAVVQYPRIGDTCWHHLALVLPQGFRQGVPFRFYLDGKETPHLIIDSSHTGGASLDAKASLFGAPFGVGNFNDGHIKIDDVRVWSRALEAAEIAAEAHPTGTGALCENAPPANWAPGPRFVPPTNEPPCSLVLGAHVLTDDTVAIVTDPNPFLKRRIEADCGAYLRAMEGVRASLPVWKPGAEYDLATWEVIIHYRPGIFSALCQSNHFALLTPDVGRVPMQTLALWPQATREFRTPSLSTNGGDVHTMSSENVYFTYLKLPFHMVPGAEYQVVDAWSNAVRWVYHEDRTISWAMKVNQLGYMADAPEKYAYLGSWLGAAGGPLEIGQFVGRPFSVCRESDGESVFAGTIQFRGDESVPTNGVILSGEKVCQMDFSAFTTPGRYYIRVPGVGRSWGFEIGQNAMGEAFYTYLRSLYYQRCGTNLTREFAAWPRGDAHTNTMRSSLPAEYDVFSDHVADGWGLMDASGHFPTNFQDGFQIVRDTATTNLVPGVVGGWHDAGDYDREWSHLRIVEDFVESYLMFPQNFTDGQAHIPESGNGIPDILDEAVWGVEVWRRAQEADGRVALSIESTSHPQIPDPNIDTEPYYLGLATHNSSLLYSEHAARLARGLAAAGATNQARIFVESARRAYAFATGGGPRISVVIEDPDGSFTWTEPAHVDAGNKSKALVQLWLATGDINFYAQLDTPEGAAGFNGEVDSLYWRTFSFDFIDVALDPGKFPAGWGERTRRAILSNADEWLAWQQAHAYRKLWYAPGEGYFSLMGWGNNGFMYIRNLVAAWRLTNDARYRSAALVAVDWMHGANPQGRVNTTGLGQNNTINPLHDPSDTDGLADPVPGICLYGYSFGIIYNARSQIYGLFASQDLGNAFDGVALAQLPPPWNDPVLSMGQIGEILYSRIPLWRNLIALEAANPPQMEFTISECQGPAAAVTGCLLGPGWTPSPALIHRQPRTEAELQDARWFHP